MAPEALKDHRYTKESDVYSLGITLWEVGSRGDLPYGRAMAHEIVIRRVTTEGLRPGRPLRFPTGLFSVAKLCWAQEPSRRITAARAAELIDARLANRSRR
jgi:serine/threonine protein kinase